MAREVMAKIDVRWLENKLEPYKFLHKYNNVNLLDFNTEDNKDFLVECLISFNPKLQYLLYMEPEKINCGIAKAATILGLCSLGRDETLTRLTNKEQRQFWVRFFEYLNLEEEVSQDIVENKISVLYERKNLLGYLKYNVSPMKGDRVKQMCEENVNREIESWSKPRGPVEDVENEDEADMIYTQPSPINCEKLKSDIDYLKISFEKFKIKENNLDVEYINFFQEFNNYVETVFKHLHNLQRISSLAGNLSGVHEHFNVNKLVFKHLAQQNEMFKELVQRNEEKIIYNSSCI